MKGAARVLAMLRLVLTDSGVRCALTTPEVWAFLGRRLWPSDLRVFTAPADAGPFPRQAYSGTLFTAASEVPATPNALDVRIDSGRALRIVK